MQCVASELKSCKSKSLISCKTVSVDIKLVCNRCDGSMTFTVIIIIIITIIPINKAEIKMTLSHHKTCHEAPLYMYICQIFYLRFSCQSLVLC